MNLISQGEYVRAIQETSGAEIDAETLLKAGVISKTLDGVKVLGNGELTKAVNVKAAAYTASAKEKIEKAGGKAEVI